MALWAALLLVSAETGGNLSVSSAAADGGVGGATYGDFVGDEGTVIGDPDAGTFPSFPAAPRSWSIPGADLDPGRVVGTTDDASTDRWTRARPDRWCPRRRRPARLGA